MIFNGDQLNFVNVIGFLLCFSGIIGHVAFKFLKSTRDFESSSHNPGSINQGPGSSVSKNGSVSPSLIASSRTVACESGKPLLDGESDVEIDDSWNR